MKKRTITVLLCLVMVIGLLPVTAQAATSDKTIQLGIGSITGYSAEKGYDYLYMGGHTPPGASWVYPLKWRVLDTKTNTGSDDGLLLLSDYVLSLFRNDPYMFVRQYHNYTTTDGVTEYHKGATPADGDHTGCVLSNVWQSSDIRTYCTSTSLLGFYEENPILSTTKSDGELACGSVYMSPNTYDLKTTATTDILKDDKIFFLSAEEASNAAYGLSTAESRRAKTASYDSDEEEWSITDADWCLRSPIAPIEGGQINEGEMVGIVKGNGNLSGTNANSPWNAARPAFNLNKSKVLFISAFDFSFDYTAGTEKNAKDGTVGQLAAIGTCAEGSYAGNSWRPTLLDSGCTFAITENTATASAGGTVTLNYAAAQHEYISAILADSTGSTALYYGKVKQLSSESVSGAVNVPIPAGLANGSYTLYVFNEDCDDDTADISSEFKKVTLTVSSSVTPPTTPTNPTNPTNPTDPTDPTDPADHHTGVNRQTASEKPAADKLESPKTGDSSRRGLWTALLVSAAGAAGTVVYSRRKRA